MQEETKAQKTKEEERRKNSLVVGAISL